jgi:lysophospholipase L1-like esterase
MSDTSDSRPSKKPRGRAAARGALVALALTLGSVVAFLGLAEVGFRVTGSYAPESVFLQAADRELPDVQTEWDLTYRTNALGLRGPLPERPRPDSVDLRVAVIGDSFVFGQGVEWEQSFPALLERRLGGSDRIAEVVNVSNIGIGAEAYYVLLKRVALPFQPDVVVVNVFGNDASRSGRRSWPRRTLATLSHRWRLASLARTFSRERARRRNREVTSDLDGYWERLVEDCTRHRSAAACRESVEAFRREHGSRVNNLASMCLREPDELRRWVEADEALPGWRDFEHYITEMAALCRARGIRFVVGIVPDAVQVAPEQLELRRALGVSYPDSVLVAPGPFQESVRRLCDRLAVECFDPLERLREDAMDLYFPTDLHWTAKGHRRYAELLHAFLDRPGGVGVGLRGLTAPNAPPKLARASVPEAEPHPS